MDYLAEQLLISLFPFSRVIYRFWVCQKGSQNNGSWTFYCFKRDSLHIWR